MELHCVFDSYPPPRTVWYHNGTELVSGANVHVSEDNHTVYLKRIDFSDLGPYVCEADNGYETLRVGGMVTAIGLGKKK